MHSRMTRGFTLIEVLIAVTIVSIAITALITASMNYTFQQGKIRDASFATWIARNVINQAQIGLITGSTSGRTQMMQLQTEWKITRTPTEDPYTDKLIVVVNNLNGDRLTSLTGFIINSNEKK